MLIIKVCLPFFNEKSYIDLAGFWRRKRALKIRIWPSLPNHTKYLAPFHCRFHRHLVTMHIWARREYFQFQILKWWQQIECLPLLWNCPKKPNCQVMFHKKRPPQDFFKGSLAKAAAGVLTGLYGYRTTKLKPFRHPHSHIIVARSAL